MTHCEPVVKALSVSKGVIFEITRAVIQIQKPNFQDIGCAMIRTVNLDACGTLIRIVMGGEITHGQSGEKKDTKTPFSAT